MFNEICIRQSERHGCIRNTLWKIMRLVAMLNGFIYFWESKSRSHFSILYYKKETTIILHYLNIIFVSNQETFL